VFEPLLYGASTGLSPLSVILSATFWAFLWGPIGLLLATPLTVCLVVLGRHVERLSFLEVMLGDSPSLRPDEGFYQRALLDDADGLVTQARQHLKETPSLAAWCDEVALGGLTLAQADWSREVLEPERAEAIGRLVALLLDEVAETAVSGPAAAAPTVLPDPAWAKPGAVLCVAGQGPFDEPAAAMAALVLRLQAGLGAEAAPNAALEAARIEALDPAVTRICLLSVLEGGSSAASVRYFLRRLRRRLPEARVVIGLWHVAPDSPMLAALRAEGISEVIVTTVGEALALCQAEQASAAAAGAAPAEPAAAAG
jgi:hypothetical protein